MRLFKALLGVTMGALAAPAFAQYPPAGDAPQADAMADRYEQYLWDGAVRTNTPDGYQTYLRRYPQGPHSGQARYQIDRLYGRSQPQPYQSAGQPYPQQAAPAYPPESAPPYPPSQAPEGYPQPAPADVPQSEGPPPPAAIEPALPPAPEPAPPPAPAAGEMAPAAPPPPPVAVAEPAPVAKGSPLFLCRPVFATGAPPFEQAGEAEVGAYLQALRINSIVAYEAYLKAYPRGLFAPAVSELVATREGRAKALAATTVPGPAQAHPRTPVTISLADLPQGAAGPASTTAIWEVAEDGCVQSCRIEKSSGSAAVDAATCRIVSSRGAYDPARDAAGKPIRSIESGTFAWGAATK